MAISKIWVSIVVATVALISAPPTSARQEQAMANFDLARPQVRLWYEGSGRLSENIAPPADFIGWNTIIGEGSAEEVANDVLFTIEVSSAGREANVPLPLQMRVTNANGRVLAQRTVRNVFIPERGRSVQGLWVQDVGCAGDVIFSASMGRVRRNVTVSLHCGD